MTKMLLLLTTTAKTIWGQQPIQWLRGLKRRQQGQWNHRAMSALVPLLVLLLTAYLPRTPTAQEFASSNIIVYMSSSISRITTIRSNNPIATSTAVTLFLTASCNRFSMHALT